MSRAWLSFLLLLPLATVYASNHSKRPVLALSDTDVSYHGVIKEDQKTVDVTPEIKIVDETGPVCSYDLRWSDSDSQDTVPFVADVTDKRSGRLALKLREGEELNCELQKTYKFSLAAKRCDDGMLSNSATLIVEIEDINNPPVFTQEVYEASVDEGKLYSNILKVEAVDRDCSQKYSEICRYEITNRGTPFSIDASGFLKNTEPLNWETSPSHVLTVVAHDCGMKSSKEAIVRISVTRSCSVGWQRIADRVEYLPETGVKVVSADARLDLCDLHCDIESVNSTVALNTKHISLGCDRDSYDVKELIRTCGINSRTVELLPRISSIQLENDTSSEEDSTSSSSSSEENGSEPADEVYLFDGKNNAIVVQPSVVKPQIPDTLTLSFWMKHDRPSKENIHLKEHILCNSDDHKMNRHHFALFVRNCKLELVFRREYSSNEENTFRPAEWRWTLAEVCDGQWHQYTVNVNFPAVQLLVDGRHLPESERNPEVLDDWPMHKVADLKTRLVVGACWHGRSNAMAEYFRGYLSSMTFLPGEQEKDATLECVHRCKESLDFQGLDHLRPGMEAIFNADLTKLTLKGSDTEGLSQLMKSVAYVNKRTYPRPGHRALTVDTSLKCKHLNTPINLPSVKSYIFVMKAPDPVLTLTATKSFAKSADLLQTGVNILSDLKISVVQPTEEGERQITGSSKLDSCRILMVPPLNKEHEYFSSPAQLITTLDLDFENNEDNGFSLKGPQKAKAYQEVLQQVHYFNLRSNHYSRRTFSLVCKMMNGKVDSNKLTVSLTVTPVPSTTRAPQTAAPVVVHSEEMPRIQPHRDHQANVVHHNPASYESHRLAHKLRLEAPLPLIHEAGYESFGGGSASGAGGVVAIIVVVVVGVILLLVIVGILKLRTGPGSRAKRVKRVNADGNELAWDDSGLNITVNPLEQSDPEAAKEHHVQEYGDSESEEDDDSCRGDDGEEYASDEEEDGVVLPHVEQKSGQATGLEWDDSTLNASPLPPKGRSHMYKV